MKLYHRPIEPRDFPACRPLLIDRHLYTPEQLEALPNFWGDLHRKRRMKGGVVEDADGKVVCFGCSVFLSDVFLAWYRTDPTPLLGPLILEGWQRGDCSPVLTHEEIRKANTTGELNLLVLPVSSAHPALTHEARMEVYSVYNQSFMQEHHGYYYREVFACIPRWARAVFESGGWAVCSGFEDYYARTPSHDVGRYYLVSVSRERAARNPLFMMSSLFHPSRARFGFSDHEREMLAAALEDHTDEELAGTLCLSVPAIKKRWTNLYARVEAVDSTVLTANGNHVTHHETGKRGSEKRRHLLHYLRTHPEELRPVLPQNARRAAGRE